MSSPRVLGLGEILWDLLPDGRQMGGAPANFAFHAAALGAESRVITRVGLDDSGVALREELRRIGLSTELLQVDPNHPTGTVSVRLHPDGQPEFTIHEQVAWDFMEATEQAFRAVKSCDALCFGSLAQRAEVSRRTIQSLVEAAPASALRILDVNLRQHYYTKAVIERSLELSNAMKLNDGELPVLAQLLDVSGLSAVEQMAQLGKRYDLQWVALTRGGSGSILWTPRRISEHPGIPTRVVDTIGAGDAFTAALATGWLADMDLDALNAHANRIGSFVCSQQGATPQHPKSEM